MICKDVELEIVGILGGNIRLVSNNLKAYLKKSYNVKSNKDVNVENEELVKAIENCPHKYGYEDFMIKFVKGEYYGVTEVFTFLGKMSEELNRKILSDMRFYYKTVNKEYPTFKEWALLKYNVNHVPSILFIEGYVKRINPEVNNNAEDLKKEIRRLHEYRPIRALKAYDIEKLFQSLWKSYKRYVKKLRTVYNHDVDETKL